MKKIGKEAVAEAIVQFTGRLVKGTLTGDDIFSHINRLQLILGRFTQIFWLIEKLETSSEYKQVLKVEVLSHYAKYLQHTIGLVKKWNLDIETESDSCKKALYKLQSCILAIHNEATLAYNEMNK